MPNRLLRSTPLRLVLWIGLAIVVGLVIAGAIAYFLVREELLARTDRGIMDTFNVIAQSYVEDDAQDLADLVGSHARASRPSEEVFLLLAANGTKVAGNIDAVQLADGWSTLTPADLGIADAGAAVRIYSGSLPPYRLIVGTSLGGVNDVAGLVVTALAYSAGGLVLVILTLGIFAARNGQRRLDTIARTMEQVARGNLAARIPRSVREDDIDILVGNVNSALDRLSALVNGMRQVSVDIAHELKTPLNRLSIAIAGASEVVEARSSAVPLMAEAEREIAQVIAIFDALLRIAQIEAGARRSRFADVQMTPLLEGIAEVYAPVAADQNQTLSLAIHSALPLIHGDRDLLTQTLANLVENAIRHCPPGAHIDIEASVVQGRTVIAVADDGPGIPDSDKPHVFDRLYRVEKSRTTPGHGLGLSLVKAIVELHGATIELSDHAPGLIVTVVFPPKGSS